MKRTAAVFLGTMMLFLIASCTSSTKGEGEVKSLYKTEEGRRTAFASYDRSMLLWTVPYSDDWVDTEYGRTHIVVSGPEDGAPLFLIPGLFGDATMWYPNAGPLSERYRVFSLDLTTYGGKSEPSGKTVASVDDYAEWFEEVLRHYGYGSAAVAGLSYGSWLSLSLARVRPDLIAAAILLDPSESFIPMDGGIAWKGLWSFFILPSRSKYVKFFDWIGGGYTDPEMDVWFEHLLDVVEFGTAKVNSVPQQRDLMKPGDFASVTMPVLIMGSGKPIVYKDPEAFAAAARVALPHAEVEIVPDAGHGLNMEKPDDVNRRTLEFLAANYR